MQEKDLICTWDLANENIHLLFTNDVYVDQ